MIEIEGRLWMTWEDTFQCRKTARMDVYLGPDLIAEIKRRAAYLGMPSGAFVKECVRRFVTTHPVSSKPQE